MNYGAHSPGGSGWAMPGGGWGWGGGGTQQFPSPTTSGHQAVASSFLQAPGEISVLSQEPRQVSRCSTCLSAQTNPPSDDLGFASGPILLLLKGMPAT